MTFPQIISFHTNDPHYTAEAQGLIESCKRLDLPLSCGILQSQGSWEANCAMKGNYVADALALWRRPLLWLDADAVVLKVPTLFENPDFEFAIYFHQPKQEFVSNTVYFAYTPRVINLVEEWAWRCEREPQVWDQKHLQAAWMSMPKNERPKTFFLPFGYAKIVNRTYEGEVFIQQNQASRRFKKIINQ